MANYPFQSLEARWQQYWADHHTYRTLTDATRPKHYVLDMFPYPSGAGLHVGHPLGYIATDIYARMKRMQGFNVLHPMGFDAFGLPAEQYAIQTGQHPATTTEVNIARYKEQFATLGLGYDWEREVRTSDPAFYTWTQTIFLHLFAHWYDTAAQKAQPITALEKILEQHGNANHPAPGRNEIFTAAEWAAATPQTRERWLQGYRLAYIDYATVNWCADLGTVLANEEVKDGLSERGGYPVVKLNMRQWFLRITAYADRLLAGLDTIEWPDSVKEAQRNWIGRSEGLQLSFETEAGLPVEVFTTRPDTIFGVSFLVLAPEHPLLAQLIAPEMEEAASAYVQRAASRSERDRMADVKTVSGQALGTHALHPFTGERLPIFIADYVLAGYGTGAIMAVPAHDERDNRFAKAFNLPITTVVDGGQANGTLYEDKTGTLTNSDFLNGMPVKEAMAQVIAKVEAIQQGVRKVRFRLRDAIFSRQRYWGEPFPITFLDGVPQALALDELPLHLPDVSDYRPGGNAESPLANNQDWVRLPDGSTRETDTMPGWAGSSWYSLRYMDPQNHSALVGTAAANYWQQVDLYVGGAEHATGHLLYARFWNQFLFDIGLAPVPEPFKKLVNQGMILGQSRFVYRINGTSTFVSHGLRNHYTTTALHVDVSIVAGDALDTAAFKNWRAEYADADFILENGQYITGMEVEKMSKSKWNVVNPDSIIAQYGADTLRVYEMFLGPLEQSKPWDTKGIEGAHRFLNKAWRLFLDEQNQSLANDAPASPDALRVLHACIKKVEADIERLSFNTAVSAYMICINELTRLDCHARAILDPLARLLAPFAPHFAEEVWAALGHKESITTAPFPKADERYLQEDTFEYPVSINGKMRLKASLSLALDAKAVEAAVLALPEVQHYLDGKPIKKAVVVPGRIVNLVV